MTYESFSSVISQICRGTDGCVLLTCNNCKYEIAWYEGGVKSLYYKLYMKPCPGCKIDPSDWIVSAGIGEKYDL